MYSNRKLITVLASSVIIMTVLTMKLIFMENKFTAHKNHAVVSNVIKKDNNDVEKFGYSDILECLKVNSDLRIQSINVNENQKCNVEVSYSGDIKLLHNSLYALSESSNFLSISSISINKDAKITSISIDFKKNK